mgnify:CR=1 FL=1
MRKLRILYVVGSTIHRPYFDTPLWLITSWEFGWRSQAAAGRKILLAISLVVNLGILGFFKYYDFFAGS